MTIPFRNITVKWTLALLVAVAFPKPGFPEDAGSGRPWVRPSAASRLSRHYTVSRPVVPTPSKPGGEVRSALLEASDRQTATMHANSDLIRQRDLMMLTLPLPFFSSPDTKLADNRFDEVTDVAALQCLASNHNPTLRQLKHQIDAAYGNMVQAGLRPNPTLALDAEEIGDGGKAGKQGLTLEQEFLTGGKRRLDRRVATWEKDLLRQQRALQDHSIQNDVRARAYEVLAAQKIVRINERLVEIGRESVQAAEELGKAGEVSKIDLLQMRAKANESLAALNTSRVNESLAWKRLAAMIGLPGLEARRIADSLEQVQPACDRETAWYRIRECSPRLAVARLEIQKARTSLARENAGRLPDLTIGGGVHYDYGERQTLGSFGVGLPLRIYDRNQGNIKRARGELAAACRELDRQVLLLYEKYAEVDAALESAREQVRLYKEQILPDVQKSLELSLQGYRQGEYGYIELLSAQQLYLETQTQYVESLKNHAVACVYLDGFLASGGLE